MLRLTQSVVILNDSGDSDDCVLDSFLDGTSGMSHQAEHTLPLFPVIIQSS